MFEAVGQSTEVSGAEVCSDSASEDEEDTGDDHAKLGADDEEEDVEMAKLGGEDAMEAIDKQGLHCVLAVSLSLTGGSSR